MVVLTRCLLTPTALAPAPPHRGSVTDASGGARRALPAARVTSVAALPAAASLAAAAARLTPQRLAEQLQAAVRAEYVCVCEVVAG